MGFFAFLFSTRGVGELNSQQNGGQERQVSSFVVRVECEDDCCERVAKKAGSKVLLGGSLGGGSGNVLIQATPVIEKRRWAAE